jgi:hypothetical protein
MGCSSSRLGYYCGRSELGDVHKETNQMSEVLWAGVEFKLAEARFFLEKMGEILAPLRHSTPYSHPARGSYRMTQWQPAFFYYLDAYLGAARSIPDVIQKCFGWDDRSKNDWPEPPDLEERTRRQAFQAEFTSLYTAFHRRSLSRVRTGSLHWLGIPAVRTKAGVFGGQEYTGGPLERIPDAAPRALPPEPDPPLAVLASPSLPVEPCWQEFTFEDRRDDGTTEYRPLFEECKAHVQAAQDLVDTAKALCKRTHAAGKLTPPPAVARENRS